MQCLTRFGEPAHQNASGLPRPRRDSGGSEPDPNQTPVRRPAAAAEEQINRLMAQLMAYEAQRPWAGRITHHLGPSGRPAARAAVGGLVVMLVILLGMWVLGHLV